MSRPPMTISSQRPVTPAALHSAFAGLSSLTFADNLASRYLDRWGVRVSTDFVWQRPGFTYSPINHMRFAPHISLAFTPPQLREPRHAEIETTTTRHILTHQRHTSEQPISFTLLEPRTHEAVTNIVEQVVSRTVRRNATDLRRQITEQLPITSSDAQTRRFESPYISELPVRSVARQQAIAQSEHPQAASLITADFAPRQQRRAISDRTHAQAEIDINALTERVVRTIDRRVIAQRERLGRS